MLNVSNPRIPEQVNAGNAHLQAGRVAEAEQAFRAALAMDPTFTLALRGLAHVLILTQRLEEAGQVLQRTLAMEKDPESFLNLGQLLHVTGKSADAVTVLQQAKGYFSNDPRVYAELGRLYEHLGRADEADAEFESALARWPNLRQLVYYHGGSLFTSGQVTRAVQLYREFLNVYAQDDVIRSAMLFVMHFLPGMTAGELWRAHQEWELRHASAVRNYAPRFPNHRDPNRRLRIGYLSPDFKNHGVGRFMAPIFAHHNRNHVEVFAYSDSVGPDAFTERLQRTADHWRHVCGRGQPQVLQQIRADQIDILVDLTMHMPGSRMLIFAVRAAPVQVTYLAYAGTTGISTMDYRLSDPQLDLPDWDNRYFEKTLRLPQSWWLYEAPTQAPPVIPRPENRPVVFASFNNFAKVSQEALETWATILKDVPQSRLYLLCPAGKARTQVLSAMADAGIAAERIEFADRASLEEYFARHNRVDVALDPFPYSGGTTSCDALWMGVPVVTLAGDMAVGRGTTSVLTTIGLPELIAPTREAYVNIAVALARDPARRASLRSTMRDRMQASPLMNGPLFIEGLEAAYRDMWKQWCANGNV